MVSIHFARVLVALATIVFHFEICLHYCAGCVIKVASYAPISFVRIAAFARDRPTRLYQLYNQFKTNFQTRIE
jgi:hypothetical protein